MSDWIPRSVWKTIVEHAPIPSVDLVVECPDGIVLGKRQNEPAKDMWFVPGGRVKKGEPLEKAIHRVAVDELGTEVDIRESLGSFEHFYETSDLGCEKHYIVNSYRVWTPATEFSSDDQHSQLRAFKEIPDNTHDYTKEYLEMVL